MSAQAAQARLAELLAKMGVEVEVAVVDEQTLQVKSDDEDQLAQLIGHHGETINALQHVLRVVLHRSGQDASVTVDIDGYRDRQNEQLQELARKRAEEVRETGQPATLPPMSSYERRVVHLELKDADGITTESTGEGRERRLVVKKA